MNSKGHAFVLILASSLLLVGCGADQPVDSTGAGTGADAPAQTDSKPALEDLSALMATADVDRGKTLYFQCRACHSLLKDAAHKVGPNLHGMFGRKAGTAPGFAYSDVLKNSDIVWDAETMNEWLARPSQFLPGNLMVFVGIKKPEDRASLIKFLQQATE